MNSVQTRIFKHFEPPHRLVKSVSLQLQEPEIKIRVK